MLDYSIEPGLWRSGHEFVAGVDEAGRGPLAGPVVAAAVIFPHGVWIEGVDDSKRLTPARRERLYEVISRCAVGIGVGVVGQDVIDRINILQATMLAMRDAVDGLHPRPEYLLVDGPRAPDAAVPALPLVDGDARCFSIAAASIIAKVTRDRLMVRYDSDFPGYGFARHKGYGTREHLEAIRKLGPCAIHRRSFRMPERVAHRDD